MTSPFDAPEYPDADLCPGDDLTDEHLNGLRRRLLGLEDAAGGWPVVESEQTLARVSDRMAEALYLAIRVAPWLAAAVAGSLVVAATLFPRLGPPLWADWCRCVGFAAVVVPVGLVMWSFYRARHCPPRWTVVEHPQGHRAVELRRLFGPAWPTERATAIWLTSSWLGRWLGLVWAAKTGRPPVLVAGMHKSTVLTGSPPPARDTVRTAREVVAVISGLWVIGVVLAHTLFVKFGEFMGDAGILLLVAAVPAGLLMYCELWLAGRE